MKDAKKSCVWTFVKLSWMSGHVWIENGNEGVEMGRTVKEKGKRKQNNELVYAVVESGVINEL